MRRIRVVILQQIILIISLASPYITLLQPYNLLYVYIPELYFSLPTEGGLSTAEFAAQNYLVILVSILECDEPHALKLVSS